MAYEIQEAKELILQAGRKLTESGLVARTWGNISARISDTEFLITPSGKAYESLTPEDIVKVRIEDGIWEGDVKPSSEKGVHEAAYRNRPDVNFIVHTHQTMATAYGVLGISLSDYGEEWKVLGDFVPCAKYGISSTKTLAKYMEEAIADCPDSNAFFMRYHGVLCLGRDAEHAFNVSSTLEKLCTEIVEKKLEEFGVSLHPETEQPRYRVPKSFAETLGGLQAVFANTPAIVEASRDGKTIYPQTDDMAQIGGTDLKCISYGPGWERRARRALSGRSVVLVKGRGAICTGLTKEDAEAAGMVLEKNCVAGLYAQACGVKHHLAYGDALLQHMVYVHKYSKLK